MANIDRKGGFRPAKSFLGHEWNGMLRMYPAADDRTADVGDLFIGDPVTLVAGFIQPLAASGDDVLGVVVALGKANSATALNTDNVARYYDPDNLSKRHLAADEIGYVGVVPAALFQFSVQSDVVDGVQGVAMDITGLGAAHGSLTTGNSFITATTSINADVSVVEFDTRPDNDVSLVDARYLVKFNNLLEG